MLDTIRQKSSTIGVYFMFAILIVVFAVGFGAVTPDAACGGSAVPGLKRETFVEVNGEAIDSYLVRAGVDLTGNPPNPKSGQIDEFYATRFIGLRLYGPFSGMLYGQEPADMSPIALVKVVNDLIETQLVSDYARELGIGISKDEFNDALALFFKQFRDEATGNLRLTSYRNWVTQSLGMSVGGFEHFVENELLRERVIQLLVGEVSPTDAELLREYKLENDKVNIDALVLSEYAIAPLVTVTDAEVTTWAAAPEHADAIKAAYEADLKAKYTTPKTFALRGLKVMAPSLDAAVDDEARKSYEAVRATAKAEAEKARADILAKVGVVGEDGVHPNITEVFGALAKEVSDDTSKDAGGDLGQLTLEALGNSPFGQAVATASTAWQANTLSEVVEVSDGFWLFLPTAITEESIQPLEAARAGIAKTLLQREKAPAQLDTFANDLLAEAKKDPSKPLSDAVTALAGRLGAPADALAPQSLSLTRLSRSGGFAPSTPSLFQLGGRAPELVRAAFSASAEKPLLERVFTTGNGSRRVIARVTGTEPAADLTDAVKTERRSRLTLEQRRAIYRGWYEDYLAKKVASGDVAFTKAFAQAKREAEEAYVQAGGVLPGVTAQATPAGDAAPKAPAAP